MLTNAKSFRTQLHAPAADQELADKLQAFGQFNGSWHLRWVSAASELDTLDGELHFGWVLGGRAIQDVWIVPETGATVAGRVGAFHGSTIRFYDPAIDGWRSTWVEPINSRVRKFIGYNDDRGGIELISRDEDPVLRWRFSEITARSFTWTGEASVDAGHTWRLEETMFATRTP
ncbi:hypothetical protein [Williamsia sp. 1135]|uniref:hypothetical protein n=1 Tax=Williamsia sp. 1135 TaxID=1889262 RepID=UPI000A10151F|nr:hypothetical protein [Williamsia sp. 1135]ORM38101.1 hypothetical protein BFL43_01315 [Williamsia sp. 1135]